MEWLSDNPWAVWLGVALALGAVEAATADFVFLMLAGGAVAGLVAGVLGAGVALQIVTASVVALLLLGTVRPVLKRRMLDRLPGAQMGVETYAGRQATVREKVDEHDGRVEFEGETWTARTDRPTIPIPPDTQVRILRVEGASLIVEVESSVQDDLPSADT